MYERLVAKVNSIDTSVFVLKTKYQTDKSGLEKKITDADKRIPDTSELFKKTNHMQKVSKTESKIPTLVKLERKSQIMIMINTLLFQNLIS